MPYRIELAVTGRAVCRDSVCKPAGVKIPKNELRLGVWVEYGDRASWAWRHWGCVSGEQIKNIREAIATGGDDEYDWDMLDGYDELRDPEVVEKVERVIKQGHIDPEDFNGDPEYNVLGQKGIRPRGYKNKVKDEDGEEGEPTPTRKSTAKRGRKKAVSDEDDEQEPPTSTPKPKRGRKKAATDDAGDDQEATTPKPKPSAAKRGRKKAEADDDDQFEPVAKKAKKVAVKEESSSTVKDEAAPAIKNEVDDTGSGLNEHVSAAKSKRGAKKAAVARQEDQADVKDEATTAIKNEVDDTGSGLTERLTAAKGKRGAKKAAVAQQETQAEVKSEAVETADEPTKEVPKAKGTRGAKRVAAANLESQAEKQEALEPPMKAAGGKRGAAKKKLDPEEDPLAEPAETVVPKKRGRKAAVLTPELNGDVESTEEEPIIEPAKTLASKKRGRKAAVPAAEPNGDVEAAVPRRRGRSSMA